MKFAESQSMHGGCSLPVEIIIRIFNELKGSNMKEYNKKMQACRQVCKLFDEIILTMFFKKGVDLGYRCQSPPCGNVNRDAVLNALNRYPRLAKDIRHIFFRSPDLHDANSQRECYRLNHKPCGTIEAWQDNSPLLHLPNVNTITVETSFLYKGIEYSGPGPISTGLRALLRHYLPAGTLTTLSISNVNDIPIPDVISSSSLVSLSFLDCTFLDFADGPPQSPMADNLTSLSVRRTRDAISFPRAALTFMPKIEVVEIRSVPDTLLEFPMAHEFNFGPAVPLTPPHVFHHLLEIKADNINDWGIFCPVVEDQDAYVSPFPQLKKMSLCVMMGEHAQANIRFLKHVKSLKELFLYKLAIDESGSYSTDLLLSAHLAPYAKTLEVLSLDWVNNYNFEASSFGYPLNEINLGLERIAGDNVLESLNLSMGIRIPCVKAPYRPDLTHLSRLTEILCLPGSFKNLKRVTLHAEVFVHEDRFSGDEKTTEMLKLALEPALLRLNASDSIDFSFTATFEADSCNSTCEYTDEEEEDNQDEDEDEEGDD
ncbi:hypothetical protein CVT24_005206 [Panaeolus cyanescens]|uniref:F-box domain-containing protein n=1 Tax=Panaeolus cyanescens TaxID=181874 RepID=A0A409Y9G7_9AGAR|nr:hypothetical protein CVT24_005206 [Panaeolus cyanescens]